MRPATTSPVSARYRRGSAVLAGMGVAAVACLLLACVVGSVGLSPSELAGAFSELLSGAPSTLAGTLLELRVTRALSAFAVGAMLALAGVMMQALLRNPLADPYVLGVSGGASVGALAAMLLVGMTWVVDAAAFGGAVSVALLLYLLAHRDLRGGIGEGNASMLLLTGVIVAAGCGAFVTLMLSIAPETRLRGMVFWLIGDLSGTQLRALPWVVLAGAMAFALRVARSMNVVALHADAAEALGVRVGALRKALFFCSALLTASAVSNGGAVGFVGLIVPHACRFALGPDHRLLLPAAALTGGTFLVVADTIARSIVAPQQLPVGVITAMIGVPMFLMQLHHIRRK